MFKTGSQKINFPPNAQVTIRAEGQVSLIRLDAKGEPQELLAFGADGVLRFRTGIVAYDYQVKVADLAHWSADIEENFGMEVPDPVPVEIPDDAKIPLSLEDTLKKFLVGVVAEKYGRESQEMETVEDFVDFDMPDEATPLSGFEVTEVTPEYPVDEDPAPSSPAEPPPEAETTVDKPSPETGE